MRLGKTGLQVSRVGIGGIPITRPPEDVAIKVIQHALDLGVNFIDTACGYGYGESEKRIGKAISGRRDQIVIATKTGFIGKVRAKKDLKLSMKQLDTDYIDLWQIGNITTPEKYEKVLSTNGAIEVAKEALRMGQIGHIGLSGHNLNVALKAVSSGHFETIQFPFNIISNEAAHELIPQALEKDVGFIANKPFACSKLKSANLAIKYLLQFDVVAIPGIEKVDEIEEIADIINGHWELTPQEQREIDEIHVKMNKAYCRHCECCMPCSRGVLIPQTLYIASAYVQRSRDWFLESGGTAAESWKSCDQCSECEKKCPYQLPIREMMAENIKFYEEFTKAEP